MAGYDFELSKGSPKQWVKKTLPLFLIKRIFFGIIVGVASLTIWGLIFIILRLNRNSKKRNIKGEGACPNTFSLSFGVNNASDFHLGNGFRFFYSLIFLLIGAASIVAIIVLSGIELILGIFFSIGILVYVLYQIYGVFTFQNLIKKYACPQCGMANAIEEMGEYLSDTIVNEVEKSTGGGRYKSGTVYLDGKEVGSVYSTASPRTYRERTKIEIWNKDFKCKCCGHRFEKSMGKEEKTIL